jgi:hypothetical protein
VRPGVILFTRKGAMAGDAKNVVAERANLAVIAAMSALWIGPTLRFWGAAFGPFRPFSYGEQDVSPSLAWVLLGATACFAPCLLPGSFYRCWEGVRRLPFYESLGVRAFRALATNGDLINRWARRKDPEYRLVRGRESMRAWLDRTREGERNHLVLLLMGMLTAAYAVWIGWYGWAAGLTAGNLVFNLYPVLLQRYNRCRITRIDSRRPCRHCGPSSA